MKTIINFCPTGMVPTKAMNASIPISTNEIIETTHEAYEVGITIVHLHARLANEEPTYKKNKYQEIIEGVRAYCPGLIICASTSGRNFPEFEKRSEVIELMPDMCSLTLSSLNFVNSASINSPKMVGALLDKMIKYGVTPELECFDLGMINYGKYLLNKKKLKSRNYWNLIFGNIAGLQPTLSQLGTAINEIPQGDHIALGGIGTAQLLVNSIAISYGLGIRVGLEDNLYYDGIKTKKATNITLLKRAHNLMEIHEKVVMPSRELNIYNSMLWDKQLH